VLDGAVVRRRRRAVRLALLCLGLGRPEIGGVPGRGERPVVVEPERPRGVLRRLALGRFQVVDAFERMAAPIDERIASNDRESRTVAALRGMLLPKLVSGELRLKNAETFLERAL
jgi:hypothetical protein